MRLEVYFKFHLGRDRVEQLRCLEIAREFGELGLFEMPILERVQGLLVRVGAKAALA